MATNTERVEQVYFSDLKASLPKDYKPLLKPEKSDPKKELRRRQVSVSKPKQGPDDGDKLG